MMFTENPELKNAIKIVWYFFSMIFILIILVTLFKTKEFITIQCEYKLKGNECSFCGMTRAFFEISKLNFQKAYCLNRGSIFLYILIILNTIIITITLIKNQLNKLTL
jgi:hypothetical protein